MANQSPSWVQVLTERPVEDFLRRVVLCQHPIESLVLVSPFLGPLKGIHPSLTRLLELIDKNRIRTYIVTNEPNQSQPAQREAVDILSSSKYTEIRFNPWLHAKVYVCKTRQIGFAMLGSGNLTETSIARRIEVGLLVSERGPGMQVFNELWAWGSRHLRQQRASRLVKRIG